MERKIGFVCSRCGCEFEVGFSRLKLKEAMKCPGCLNEFKRLEKLAEHLEGLEELLRENKSFLL